jgi:PAS domain S-box-containing protein
LRYIIVNDIAVKFLGGKSEKDLINKTDYDCYPKEEADFYLKEDQEIINSGKPIINIERKKYYNGKEIFFSTTKCPIINTKGETIGFVVIAIDITEKKKAQLEIERQSEELKNYNNILNETNILLEERQQQIEEQAEELRVHSDNIKEANDLLLKNQIVIQEQSKKLEETNEQLSLLNATKDKFFSIIGHDLRNPFNVTIGSSEMLLKSFERFPPEKIRKFLKLIYNASKNGNSLLDNLLQWSRTQTSRISYLPSKLKLLTVFEQAIALLEGDALRKNITLEKMIDPDIIVMVDENMIKTIFRNLVSNAIKFTHEKGNVTIKAAIDNQFVEITVSDTGVGIPLENIDKLFRIDTTITTKGTLKESGTGIGLILCKEFVEKHDGKIWVESEEGKGSKFKFTLPLA